MPKADPGSAKAVVLQNASADYNQDGLPPANAIDGNRDSGWAIDPQAGKDHFALFETKEDVGQPGGTTLSFTFDQQYPDGLHTLGKFRLSVTTSKRPFRGNDLPGNVAAILAVAAEQRSDAMRVELAQFFRSQDPDWVRMKQCCWPRRLCRRPGLVLINSPAFLFNR